MEGVWSLGQVSATRKQTSDSLFHLIIRQACTCLLAVLLTLPVPAAVVVYICTWLHAEQDVLDGAGGFLQLAAIYQLLAALYAAVAKHQCYNPKYSTQLLKLAVRRCLCAALPCLLPAQL